jgi:hypothetical protein
LPYFHVTQTSIREVLSIPFQQTARYVKYYGNDVTDNEFDDETEGFDESESDDIWDGEEEFE